MPFVAFPTLSDQWHVTNGPGTQWRDRAGFSPASPRFGPFQIFKSQEPISETRVIHRVRNPVSSSVAKSSSGGASQSAAGLPVRDRPVVTHCTPFANVVPMPEFLFRDQPNAQPITSVESEPIRAPRWVGPCDFPGDFPSV